VLPFFEANDFDALRVFRELFYPAAKEPKCWIFRIDRLGNDE
jgi:hypothetical protein